MSGDRLPHPLYSDSPQEDHWKFRPVSIKSEVSLSQEPSKIFLSGAQNVTVEGITIANSALHSLNLMGGYDPSIENEVTWVKIFTWRANGDGINPFGNTLVEDCFIREGFIILLTIIIQANLQNYDEFDEGLREALACNILNNLKLKLRGNSAQIVNRNLLSPLEIAKQTQQVCSSVYVWIKT